MELLELYNYRKRTLMFAEVSLTAAFDNDASGLLATLSVALFFFSLWFSVLAKLVTGDCTGPPCNFSRL